MIKYGDKVRIRKDSPFYGADDLRKDGRHDWVVQNNPKDMDGLVIETDLPSMFGFNIKVRWENGRSNNYNAESLEVVDGTD
jgi:hypothetical protein